MPSGSFEFGLAMPMAPNQASPMAQSHVSTDCAEVNFVPSFKLVKGKSLTELGKDCLQTLPYILLRTNHLGRKFWMFLQKMWKIAAAKEFVTQNSSSSKMAFNTLKIAPHSVCLPSTQSYGLSCPMSKKSKTSDCKTHHLCFPRA